MQLPTHPSHDARFQLPSTGYIRQSQLIGESTVTPAQAAANKILGKGPRRPRPGIPAIVPWSSATLWRRVKEKSFPAPAKLSERVTAWSVESISKWLADQAAKGV